MLVAAMGLDLAVRVKPAGVVCEVLAGCRLRPDTDGVQDALVLGAHCVGVGLVVDRVQQRPHPRPGRRPDRLNQPGWASEVTS